MITIQEHSFEERIIDKKGWILDLGCVNFIFSEEVKKYCDNIICVDPSPLIKEIPKNIFFENYAITSDENLNEIDYYIYNDKSGNSLINNKNDIIFLETSIKVKATTINKLMKKYNIKHFELIKFDIEGSEYDILSKMDWLITKQISVEFHDFRKMNPFYPNDELYYDKIFEKNKNNFDIVQHKITNHAGFPNGLGKNYWDSLFLKKTV